MYSSRLRNNLILRLQIIWVVLINHVYHVLHSNILNWPARFGTRRHEATKQIFVWQIHPMFFLHSFVTYAYILCTHKIFVAEETHTYHHSCPIQEETWKIDYITYIKPCRRTLLSGHLPNHPMAMQEVECHHNHINTTVIQIMLLSDTNIVVNWESKSTIHGSVEHIYTHA